MTTVIATHRSTWLARARAEYRRRLVAAADRLHARGDERARAEGWSVTRVGTTRVYRAAEFDRIGGTR